MTSFLQLVASDLLKRYGNDMRHTTVVFPSRRASSYLCQELARQSERPVWTPNCITISELFAELSPYREADKIASICQLYQQYIRFVGPQIEAEEGAEALERESLDRFWSWGEVMLSDIDDIDKHLADARAIFTLVKQTEELADLEYLTEEQRIALQRFLGYTIERGTLLKRRFMRLWENMSAIYEAFNAVQQTKGERYQGAIYRDVCERIRKEEITDLDKKHPNICFVGFNALNDVERQLMKAFQKQSDAHFYWDYDAFYTERTESEAGLFMRSNLVDFPSALPKECFDNLKQLQDVTILACSTDNAQARYANEWLKVAKAKDESFCAEQSAVVLCNEGLLMPVMHVIDKEQTTNATMGFNLIDTPIYGFVNNLIQLQTDGYDARRGQFRYSFLQLVHRHPLAAQIDEEEWNVYASGTPLELLQYLQRIVRRIAFLLTAQQTEQEQNATLGAERDSLQTLYIEAAFQICRIFDSFIDIVQNDEMPMAIGIFTLRRLMSQALNSMSVPFHGDQTKGLQVMGVLETRCLDFQHLLMVAVEEGCLPKGLHDITLIPPHIKEAFGLTTQQHKVAIYSYYFYRLIQRAEHLTCTYNDNTLGVQNHEISRFLRQLQAETDLKIEYKRLIAEPDLTSSSPISAPNTERVQQKLQYRFAQNYPGGRQSNLSPSAINRYMKCPKQFYFQDVAQIYEQNDAQEGVDAPLMGNIFHDTAEVIYSEIKRQYNTDVIDQAPLSMLLNEKDKQTLRWYLDIVFDVHYFHPNPDERNCMPRIMQQIQAGIKPNNEYKGQDIIIRDVLMSYLQFLLQYDYNHAPFVMHRMEQEVGFTISVETEKGEIVVKTGGRVDRMDEKDGVVRIVDYKTGSTHESIAKLEDVFQRDNKHPNYCFQTLLYALAVHKEFKGTKKIRCALLYPAQANQEDYNPELKLGNDYIEDVRKLLPEFETKLKSVVEEIFTTKEFGCTEDSSVCKYCNFRILCGKA